MDAYQCVKQHALASFQRRCSHTWGALPGCWGKQAWWILVVSWRFPSTPDHLCLVGQRWKDLSQHRYVGFPRPCLIPLYLPHSLLSPLLGLLPSLFHPAPRPPSYPLILAPPFILAFSMPLYALLEYISLSKCHAQSWITMQLVWLLASAQIFILHYFNAHVVGQIKVYTGHSWIPNPKLYMRAF